MKENIAISLNNSVGIKGPEMEIGPWAESKDIKSSEGRWILMGAYKLVVRGRNLVMRD